jgi:hypothetical protein
MPNVNIDVYAETHDAPKKLKDVEAGLDGIDSGSKKADSTLGGLWKQFFLGGVALGAAKEAFRFLSDAMGDCIKGAMEEEQSQLRLKTALDSTGRTTSAMLPVLQAYAVELSKGTLYTHEQAEESMTLLAQLTNLDTKGIQGATRSAMGLATVLKMDLESATMMVVKATEGNTQALRRAGIMIDASLKGDELKAEVLEKTAALYVRAQAETQTYGGRIKDLGK